MVFTLIRGKVMAVTLGAEGVGATALIDQMAVLIAQLTAFSLPLAGVKFLSAADSDGREAFERLYGTLFRVLAGVSMAGAAVAMALLFWRPSILGAGLINYRSAAILGMLVIPATNLTVLLTNAIAASRRTRASAIYGLAISVALAVFCWIGVMTAGVHGYYVANVMAMSAAVAGGVIYLARSRRVSLWGARIASLRQLRSYSAVAKFSAIMYVTSFTSPASDLLVRYAVLETGGLATTGLFQAAAGLGLILRNVLRPSFSLFLTPVLNRKGTPAEKLREAMLFLRVLTALLGIGALPLVMFPKWWLLLLYSRQFEVAAPAVYLFVVGVGIQLLGAVNIALLLGLDDTPAFVQATILADIATAIFAWWLAPNLGLNGVGIAFIVDGLVTLILTTWWLLSRHQMAVHRNIGWMPPVVFAVVATAGAWAARWETANLGVAAGKAALCAIFAYFLLRAVGGKDLNRLWRSFAPSR